MTSVGIGRGVKVILTHSLPCLLDEVGIEGQGGLRLAIISIIENISRR